MEHRFVTIAGAGGLGKSVTATAVSHQLAEVFGSAIMRIDFSGIDDPDLVCGAVASAFGINSSMPHAVADICAHLGDKRLLLVLDNCEHVIGAVASISEELLRRTRALHILATSREIMRVEGELVYRLQPLRCPAPGALLSLAEASSYPAVQLFIERAYARGTRIELSNQEARLIAAICNKLDGLPLAIDIVASRVGLYGLAGIVELLNKRGWLSWPGLRTAHPRHQTFRALLDWSHKTLTDSESTVLRRLSVFKSGFSLDAACTVLSDAEIDHEVVIEAISSLIDKSLVLSAVEASGAVSCRLPEPVRTFALEKLEQSDEAESLAQRHAGYTSQLHQDCGVIVGARQKAHMLSSWTQMPAVAA